MATLIFVLIAIVLVFLVGWVAKWIIDQFFPEPIRLPASVVVGLVLLVVLLFAMSQHFGIPLTTK
jgi:O-antigen/teichoic acid export membrane protein